MTSRQRLLVSIAWLTVFGSALGGCGQMGPLTLPDDGAAAAATASSGDGTADSSAAGRADSNVDDRDDHSDADER